MSQHQEIPSDRGRWSSRRKRRATSSLARSAVRTSTRCAGSSDGRGLLTSTSAGGQSSSLAYDGEGRQISQTTGGMTTRLRYTAPGYGGVAYETAAARGYPRVKHCTYTCSGPPARARYHRWTGLNWRLLGSMLAWRPLWVHAW